MRTSFIHAGDVRLGYRDPEQPDSFAQTAGRFQFAVDLALEQRAELVLFAGNLFDSPAVDPASLQVALRGLLRLREKGIPAVAIRGSRDAGGSGSAMSWYDLLTQENLLTMLDAHPAGGQLKLVPCDRRAGAGGYLDVGRTRLFGLGYSGLMTGLLLGELAQAIGQLDNRETDFRIVLLHAGLEQAAPGDGPKLSYSDLLGLQRLVHYVALGGSDCRYETDGWAYNPGVRGVWHVAADTAVTPKFVARHVAFPNQKPIWPPPEPEPQSRAALELEVQEELLSGPGGSDSERRARREVMALLRALLHQNADPEEVLERLLNVAAGERAARAPG
ncbi:MAG: hypothetical protein KGJ86_11425 [Chloroflexota bacterium]|nr:hypothetical protein [Chloroflexota bacterium]